MKVCSVYLPWFSMHILLSFFKVFGLGMSCVPATNRLQMKHARELTNRIRWIFESSMARCLPEGFQCTDFVIGAYIILSEVTFFMIETSLNSSS